MPFRKLGDKPSAFNIIGSPKRSNITAFAPTDIPGLILWLTASSGLFQNSSPATIPSISDDDPIGTWEDQSGNNNNVAQTVAGERPLLKIAVIGGKNAVRFASASSQHLFASLAFLTGASGSVFVTLQQTSVAIVNQTILGETDKDVAGNDVVSFLTIWSPGAVELNPFIKSNAGGAGFNVLRTDTDLVVSTPSLISYRSNSTIYTIRQNGVDEALIAPLGVNNGDWFDTIVAPDTVTVGARIVAAGDNQHFDGDMRQLLVYDSNLTGDDLTNVETFLADDVGIILP